ncbi:hypothetical protein [Saccharopolyspora griseoalba]|uniref:Uncharacterized protein n=1 Tax=Saccharopolyspora griseoalba TaxID=1431848 RepID=A0ABW2LFS0_9PSEU
MASHPLRPVLGVRGPLLGGPVLLARCWWLVPLALLVVAPFQLASWSLTCHLGSCAESLTLVELLGVPGSLLGSVAAHVYRGALSAPPLLLITAAATAGLTAASARTPIGIRTALREIAARARPLGALIAFSAALPVISLLAPVALWRLLFGPLADNLRPDGLRPIAIGVLLVVLLFGALAAMTAAIVALVATVPVVLEGCSAVRAFRRTLSLAVKRVLPTFGTVLLVLVASEFVAAAMDVLWRTADLTALPAWLGAALNATLGDAVSLPLTAAMYFVRYVDLRARDGFQRADLVRAAPGPR